MKDVLRLIYRLLVLICVAPLLVLARLSTYVHVAELVSLVPFRFGERLRYEFYRHTLAACGEDVIFNFGVVLSYRDITVGSHVWIGTYNIIGHADLRDYTLTAQGCHIVSGARGHGVDRLDVPMIKQQGAAGRVSLGPDAWLGAGAVVMANVGRGCIVGAGSVVTHDVPDWAVAAGNPARVLRYRTAEEARPESA